MRWQFLVYNIPPLNFDLVQENAIKIQNRSILGRLVDTPIVQYGIVGTQIHELAFFQKQNYF